MKPIAREEEVICPSCKRYVGMLEKCPYCGAKVPKRLAFRVLKWGGLALGILGVLFLYVDLHTTNIIVKDVPVVGISDIQITMNFAQVIVPGKVTFAKYYKDEKNFGMYIADNFGNEIYVRIYDSETKRLIEAENQRLAEGSSKPIFPAVGDMAEVQGQLRIRPGFNMMILQYIEGLEITRPEATPITIEQLMANPENFEDWQRFEVEGKITSTYDLGWANSITLYEMSTEAETTLLIPNSLNMFGSLDAQMGDTIRVKGAFSLYYGKPQLWLASWEDLEVL